MPPPQSPKWTYRVVYRGGVHVRASPSLDGELVGDEILEFDQVLEASKSVSLDGIVYVKLLDNRGWVFERRGAAADALQILELVSYEGPSARGLSNWQLSLPEVELTAAARATSLEELVAAAEVTRDATLRQISGALRTEAVDFSRFSDALWAVAKLDRDRHEIVVARIVAQADQRPLSAADRRHAADIFDGLEPKFHRLVASLVPRADHRLKDFVRAWIVLRFRAMVHDIDDELQDHCASTKSILLDEARAAAAATVVVVAGAFDALFSNGKRCLADPDLQFALTF